MIGALVNKVEKIFVSRGMLTDKERELFKKVKDLKISHRVYWYYNTYIKEIDDTELVRKKLIRNIMLSKEGEVNKERPYRRVFYYGNLTILVDFYENEIVWLKNCYGKLKVHGVPVEEFTYDYKKKEYLNKILEIKN